MHIIEKSLAVMGIIIKECKIKYLQKDFECNIHSHHRIRSMEYSLEIEIN